jgi:Tfp pilus assembly protein PilO
MITLQQQLYWWFEKLGWIGVSGITLFLLSLMVYTFSIAPGQAEITQLGQALTDEQQMALKRDSHAKDSEQSANRKIGMLTRDFPRHQEVSKVLNRLYAAASNSNLILQRGVYKLVRDTSSPFLRYEIDLPLQGRYPEIQLFAYQALKEIPALALDDISFKRENAGSSLVQAKLHFTLYMLENL